MDRRTFLGIVAGSVLSGCNTVRDRQPETETDRSAREPSPSAGLSLAEHGFPPTICDDEPNLELVRAVVEPAFAANWSNVDVPDRYQRTGGLTADSTVIGVTGDGRTRAYPLVVLRFHEVVNDTLKRPLLVTYCPLCRSGMVADRTVDGAPTRFGVSGLLWKAPRVYAKASEAENNVFGVSANGTKTNTRNTGNLVLYDAATGSRWSQILARGICGPLRGTDLEIVPSTVTSWGEWQREHPEADVLLPPPYSVVGNPPLPPQASGSELAALDQSAP